MDINDCVRIKSNQMGGGGGRLTKNVIQQIQKKIEIF